MADDNIEHGVERIAATRKYSPEAEHRRSFLSLRWLVIILAGYLTLFSHLNSSSFPILSAFVVLFAATNVPLYFIPQSWFERAACQRAITLCDCFFIGATFFLLRSPETYLYLGFVLIFLLAVIWRDLRIVLFSLLTVSMLFGVFNGFRIARFALNVSIEHFLTLSLFFVVSIFYLFLSSQLARDARLSLAVLEEKRNAEIMVEITRGLASSLKTQDILKVIVIRLREVVNAEDCSIIVTNSKTGGAQVMLRSSDPGAKETDIDLASIPELREAFDSRRIIIRDVDKRGVIAVPMVAQDTVIGIIHVIGETGGKPPSEGTVRFFEVMASTAANALRNAQMFEEVEHRARTDFLTGLSNHRYFQATLSAEMGRAQRHNHPLSLLMIDLDFLKKVNDTFGHPIGDMVIRATAETIQLSCREFDFAARYGGEEFAVILPETPLAGALNVAERIRDKISKVRFKDVGTITTSIGVSNYPTNALAKEDLVSIADQALYIAKKSGRDRVAYFNYQLTTK